MSPLGRKKPLRRSTGLPRGTKPLKPGPPLVRHTPLRSTSPLSSGTPRPTPFRPQRPSGPSAAERRARELVRARAAGLCEGCGRPGPTDWSHRVGRGQCGPWHPANGLALCRTEHSWAGEHPRLARERYGWILRSTDDFLTFPAWLIGHGWCLLTADGGIEPTERRTA